MIERKRRISRATFPSPQIKRVVVFGDIFTTTFYPNNHSKISTFCVIASKKVYKTAVKRNQFKRWVYEALRIHKNELDKSYKGVLVFSAKKTTEQVSFQLINSEIELVLKKKPK